MTENPPKYDGKSIPKSSKIAGLGVSGGSWGESRRVLEPLGELLGAPGRALEATTLKSDEKGASLSPSWLPKLEAKSIQNRYSSVPEGILVENSVDFECSCKGSRFGHVWGGSECRKNHYFQKAF